MLNLVTGGLAFDTHPVMPLDKAAAYPFPRQALNTMLMDGDVENAQELAYQTALSHGLAFPEPERHYWQTHYRPVETPDGEKLGTALFVTEFPQLPPDFDDYIDENGMDDSVYPTEARTLEMAHFADEKDAAKFDAEFRGYL